MEFVCLAFHLCTSLQSSGYLLFKITEHQFLVITCFFTYVRYFLRTLWQELPTFTILDPWAFNKTYFSVLTSPSWSSYMENPVISKTSGTTAHKYYGRHRMKWNRGLLTTFPLDLRYHSTCKMAATIKQTSVGKSQILSSRRQLANLKYYQTDVCWQMSNTIKQTSDGKSQILSSPRR